MATPLMACSSLSLGSKPRPRLTHSAQCSCITTWLASSGPLTCPICRAETHSTPAPSYHLSSISESYFKASMAELRRGGLDNLAEEQEVERADRRTYVPPPLPPQTALRERDFLADSFPFTSRWTSLRSTLVQSPSTPPSPLNRLARLASIAESLSSPTFARRPAHPVSLILEESVQEEARREMARWGRLERRERREDERSAMEREMERRALEERLASTEFALGRLQAEPETQAGQTSATEEKELRPATGPPGRERLLWNPTAVRILPSQPSLFPPRTADKPPQSQSPLALPPSRSSTSHSLPSPLPSLLPPIRPSRPFPSSSLPLAHLSQLFRPSSLHAPSHRSSHAFHSLRIAHTSLELVEEGVPAAGY